MKNETFECSDCGNPIRYRRRNYLFTESGLHDVVLQDLDVADCSICGNFQVSIPRLNKILRAIASAIENSPTRLTGPQLRFLRTHLELSGDQFAKYLHTDKTKISKWENGEDRIGPTNDRLIRLLVAALDKDLIENVPAIVAHLPNISDDPNQSWTLNIYVENLTYSYEPIRSAA